MYQVLIADDEPSVVSALRGSIDWEELGLEVVKTATNGHEIIEYIEKNHVDIVILDIRMPGPNGLEVCERIRRFNEDIQIIIISGYAEFSYAERAIRYGVLGYCLKPLEYDQIRKLLLKAGKNCEKKGHPNYESDFLELIEKNNSMEIKRRLMNAGFSSEKIYVAASVGDRILPIEERKVIIIELGREQYVYFSEEPLTKKEISEGISKRGILGVGYEETYTVIEKISNIVTQCQTKAFQYFINPEQRMCSKLNYGKSAVLIEKIKGKLSKCTWEDMIKELQLLEEKHWRDFTIRSALKLCNMVHSSHLFEEEGNDYYVYSLRQLTSEYKEVRQMLRRLQKDIKEAKEQQKNKIYTNTAFMMLMDYIENNYTNDISLTSAAESCNMSANYVSQLFKKETGITFVRYITQRRMETAIKLLETTKKTTAEISTLVGFNDYFYFLKTFKKFTGKTLSQYRSEL